jgi:predicted nucleic acid-binding protein
MAVPIRGKVLLDTNVLIDFLRAGMHTEWVLGGQGTVVRFISAVALLELQIGADTPKRQRAVDRLHQAFRSERIIGLAPSILDRAGRLFRSMHGNASALSDRLGPMNDILIALTAREIGATVITGNALEFRRIAGKLPGLKVVTP